mgnify:CR=1 FL=1
MNHRSIIVRTIALVLTALVISGCGGAEGRKAKFLERGKEYFVQENYSKALIEFKNALQIDPGRSERAVASASDAARTDIPRLVFSCPTLRVAAHR